MAFDIKGLIKENIKFLVFMLVIIIAGIFGITYALKVATFNKIGVDIDTSSMDVSITYDSSTNNSNVISTGNLLPISDELVTGTNVSDSRVLKVKFYVTGSSSNPENSIYDIAIHDFDVDCDLRTTDVKWRLYKNNSLLSSGNLSPLFDTMSDNRLVLTETQQDLTTSSDEYVFLLWISESCTGDISTCGSDYDQSKYMDKTLSGSIKVEMATKTKKELVRITGSEASCKYVVTNTPNCNTLTYNGSNQFIINEGSGYSLSGNIGNEAGEYNVTAMVNDGYKWSNGSTDDKVIKCNIDKKEATINATSQSIKYGSAISNSYTISGIVASHSVSDVYLDTDISEVGSGRITPTRATIVDGSGNDVTSNYDITYKSGTLVINCLNTAIPPTVSNKNYTSNEQVGVSGGENIVLDGTLKATLVGEYSVSATPRSNYCWNDNSTTKREYTWSIVENAMLVTLSDKSTTYTGSAISIGTASITDGSGTSISGPVVTYNYYNGSSCSGSVLSGAPVNAGSYSVKAVAGAYQGYKEAKSNCATLTINKASSTLDVSLSESLTYGINSSVGYTFSPAGSVSCSSSDTNVATCSIDSTNKKVSVVPARVGSATITVTGTPSNSNYNSSSVSKNVTVGCSPTATEPSVVTGLTYTGSSQTGLSGGTNVVFGNSSAINAGDYIGTATPSDNYCWSDRTIDPKSYNWTISKANNTVSVTAKTGLTYNGSEQELVTVSKPDETIVHYSISTELTSSNYASGEKSIPKGTDAGTYTVYYYAPESANYHATSGSVDVTIGESYWKNNSGNYFVNIADAVKDTASGGTITLLQSYTESYPETESVVNLSKTITIKTDGYVLGYDSKIISGESQKPLITISSGGVLNVTGGGTINLNNGDGIVNNGGKFICDNTTFTGSLVHLYNKSGTMVNNSCTFNKEEFIDENYFPVVAVYDGHFEMSGGSINGPGGIYQTGGTVDITGGTVSGKDYGIHSESGNLNIGTAPSNGTSSNRHTNNRSNKVSPRIESTGAKEHSGIYIKNSVFRMYNGMVYANNGAAIRVTADNTNDIAIDGGALISENYVAYYNLSNKVTYFTGDARVVSNSSSSAINTAGNIQLNNDNDVGTIGLNGIQTYYNGCSGDSCVGRYWGTWLMSKSGYGIYGNNSSSLYIGNKNYTEDTTVAEKTYRNQGTTICAGSSSFAKIANLYWFVGWSFNGINAYKSNVTNMSTDTRDYVENLNVTANVCAQTIDGTAYSVDYSYYSYPKTKGSNEPTGTKVTTIGNMYSWRPESTCNYNTDTGCGENSGDCNTLGILPSGKTIYLIEKSSVTNGYYNAWVKVSDFSSYPGPGYKQLMGVNNNCSGTSYTTGIYGGVKYVKVRLPLGSCTGGCCASSCTLS